MRVRYTLTTISLIITSLGISGCGLFFNGNQAGIDQISSLETSVIGLSNSQHDQAARNLVYVLSQIDNLSPLKTTLQIVYPKTPFGKAVFRRLDDAGYGLQRVEGDKGEHFVRYKAETAETELGYQNQYSISVGNTRVQREYQISDNKLIPVSEVVISGSTVDLNTVNDTKVFDDSPNDDISRVASAKESSPIIKDFLEGNVVLAASSPDNTFTHSVKQNMYETRRSNYESVFQTYNDIQQHILVFPNDSMLLGRENKSTINSLVDNFDSETHLLSVIGCSHGKTMIDNGNNVLALGRANRVKEELIIAGVDPEYIYDEGCWAPVHFDNALPRRGVVLTLKEISS